MSLFRSDEFKCVAFAAAVSVPRSATSRNTRRATREASVKVMMLTHTTVEFFSLAAWPMVA